MAGRRALILVFLAVAALAGVALAVSESREQSQRIPAAEARHAALAHERIAAYLREHPYDRVRVSTLDERAQRVTFFDGPRVVLDAAVEPGPSVRAYLEYPPGYIRSGHRLLRSPAAIAALLALFALACVTVPLRSMRNLDVLVLSTAGVQLVLLNDRLFEASVYPGFAMLCWLVGRCALVAAGRSPGAAAEGTPLWRHLSRNLDPGERTRLARLVVGALALAVVVLSVTSTGISDVALASLAGATKLLDGDLPYGALTLDVVHGDTYPLLNYVMYVPAALVLPVRDSFDNLDGALWITAAAALAGAAAFWRMAGVTGALAWLAYPAVTVTATSGANDLVVGALVAWALALFARPFASSLLLALAGWVKLVPLAVFPPWAARLREGGLAASLGALAAVTALVAVLLVALGGIAGIGDMLDAISFQFERGSLLSLWTLTGWKAVQVVLQALLLGGIAAATLAVWLDPELAGDRRRMAALLGALMLGFQLTANYWTPAYLPWALPCVALALLFGARREPIMQNPPP